MNPHSLPASIRRNKLRLSLALALLPLGAVAQPDQPVVTAPDTATDSFLEKVFLEGKILFNFRARYEFADQSGLDAAHAATARTRLGYTTNTTLPLSATLEFEDIRALDGSTYNQAGINDQPQKTVVADPEITELNQAFLLFKQEEFSAKIGRQRLLVDNQRFIGNSGWRQNEQTFDAATLQYQIEDGPEFLYSYVNQINRILGRDHPAGKWDSESHLIHARSPLGLIGTGGAYAYLLQFETAPVMSGDTFGLWLKPHLSVPVKFHFEIAHQSENSGNPSGADFGHLYYRGELEFTIDHFTSGGGFERMEGDGTTSFQTPLAGLHGFNGWADQFLTTPVNGLDDIFLFASAKLPGKISARAEGHHFSSQRGSETYGHEVGLILSRSLGQYASVLTKAALFDGKEGRPDVTKLSLQTEIRF